MKLHFYLISLLLFGCATHKTATHIALANQQMHSFAKEMRKEKNLFVDGSGGAMMDQINEFSLSFESYDRKLSVQEARKLIVEVIERFQKEVNENEKIRPHLANFPIGPNNMRLTITFHENFHKRVPDEFVAMVWQRDGMLHYSYFDAKEQRYKNENYDHDERYEEALKLVKMDEE